MLLSEDAVRQYIARILSEHNACPIPDCPSCAKTVNTLAATSVLIDQQEKKR
jgi:hypothetical protein